jgi:hypothetical protein
MKPSFHQGVVVNQALERILFYHLYTAQCRMTPDPLPCCVDPTPVADDAWQQTFTAAAQQPLSYVTIRT